jgi:hypothetical protein
MVFAPEMLALLKEKAFDMGQRTWSAYFYFYVAESLDLLKGAAGEWIAKLTNKSYATNQRLLAGTDGEASLPAEVRRARKHIKLILACMEHAIANHQFEKARFYSYAEHRARKRLQKLQEKHNIAE